MKNNFVAFDFETSYGHIPCSIGIIEFIDGKVMREYYSLIKPIDLRFNPINSSINGIRLKDVCNEREFDEVWIEIEHFFSDRVIVAHNSITDLSILKKTLDFYKIIQPNFECLCTLNIAKRIVTIENYKLSALAKHFNIEQNNYHNSLEDAFVCGKIFLEMFENYSDKIYSIDGFVKSTKSINQKKNTISLGHFNNSLKVQFSCETSNKLVDTTFVLSGTFENFTREQLQEKILANGGTILSGISGKLNYLVAGENMGPSKLEKATKMGIKILSETDFLKLLN